MITAISELPPALRPFASKQALRFSNLDLGGLKELEESFPKLPSSQADSIPLPPCTG